MERAYQPTDFLNEDNQALRTRKPSKALILTYPIFLLNQLLPDFWRNIPISWVKDIVEKGFFFISKPHGKLCLRILDERLKSERWWSDLRNSGISTTLDEAAKDFEIHKGWLKTHIFQDEKQLNYWLRLDLESFSKLSRNSYSDLNVYQLYLVKERLVDVANGSKSSPEYKNTMKKIDFWLVLRKKQDLPVLYYGNQPMISIHRFYKILKYDLPPTKKIQEELVSHIFDSLLMRFREDDFVHITKAIDGLSKWYFAGESNTNTMRSLSVDDFLNESNILTTKEMIDLLGFKGTVSRMNLNERIGFIKIGEIDKDKGSLKSKKTLFLKKDVINYALNNAIHISPEIANEVDYESLIKSKAHRRLKIADSLDFSQRLDLTKCDIDEHYHHHINQLYKSIMLLSLLLVWYRFTDEDKITLFKLYHQIKRILSEIDFDEEIDINQVLLEDNLEDLMTFLSKEDLTSASAFIREKDQKEALAQILNKSGYEYSGYYMIDDKIKDISLKTYFQYTIYKKKNNAVNEFLRLGEYLARKALNVSRRHYGFYTDILLKEQGDIK